MAFDFEGFDKSVVTLCHWAEYLINLQPWRQQIFHHGVESSSQNDEIILVIEATRI